MKPVDAIRAALDLPSPPSGIDTIVLSKGQKSWMATFSGPQVKQLLEQFGTDTLPTPFKRDAKPGDVYSEMRPRNPGCRIGFLASDIGPNIADECQRQGCGNVLWMRDDR